MQHIIKPILLLQLLCLASSAMEQKEVVEEPTFGEPCCEQEFKKISKNDLIRSIPTKIKLDKDTPNNIYARLMVYRKHIMGTNKGDFTFYVEVKGLFNNDTNFYKTYNTQISYGTALVKVSEIKNLKPSKGQNISIFPTGKRLLEDNNSTKKSVDSLEKKVTYLEKQLQNQDILIQQLYTRIGFLELFVYTDITGTSWYQDQQTGTWFFSNSSTNGTWVPYTPSL